MSDYRTPAQDAAEIRQALKMRHRWSSRDVSVRAESYSMGSTIHVEIKRADIPLPVVEAIANRAEKIDRDPSGEILSGGNRFVDVKYSLAAVGVLRGQWLAPVEAALAELPPDDTSRLVPVAGTPYLIGRKPGRLSLWHTDLGHVQNYYDPQGLAYAIGARMVATAHAS